MSRGRGTFITPLAPSFLALSLIHIHFTLSTEGEGEQRFVLLVLQNDSYPSRELPLHALLSLCRLGRRTASSQTERHTDAAGEWVEMDDAWAAIKWPDCEDGRTGDAETGEEKIQGRTSKHWGHRMQDWQGKRRME